MEISPNRPCPFTGLKIKKYQSDRVLYYTVDYYGQILHFTFCPNCLTKIPENFKELIGSLAVNGKIAQNGSEVLHWRKQKIEDDGVDLKQLIDTASYPRTPKEKIDTLFKHIHSLQKFDGDRVTISELLDKKFQSLYFKNTEEITYYIQALERQGDIHFFFDGRDYHCKITFQGLTNLIRISEEGFNSNNCFIAMAFNAQTTEIRRAIKEAVFACGYIPILVDEMNINSDKTINDEIIVQLRGCKFCVADFSYHKNGVYFESGFALGQGKPVIYTCLKEEFENAHFDIKPLQHIIYKKPEELKDQLTNKIKAWIN